jgi:hypothetical protein
MNNRLLNEIIQYHINEDKDCKCKMHQEHGRVPDELIAALAFLLNTENGFAMIMSIVAHCVSYDYKLAETFFAQIEHLVDINSKKQTIN